VNRGSLNPPKTFSIFLFKNIDNLEILVTINTFNMTKLRRLIADFCHSRSQGGGGVLPYMGYVGMCGPKGYGFSAVLVINVVSNFGHFGHIQGRVFAF